MTLLIVNLYKIRCNTIHPLTDVLPGPYVPVLVTHSALVAHWYTYSLSRCKPLNSIGLLFPSHCPSGMILLTLCSMVWGWWVSRVGIMLFYWPKQLYPTIVIYYFSLSHLPVYRLVLWGWGLWTDNVYYITLSQPCTADLF